MNTTKSRATVSRGPRVRAPPETQSVSFAPVYHIISYFDSLSCTFFPIMYTTPPSIPPSVLYTISDTWNVPSRSSNCSISIICDRKVRRLGQVASAAVSFTVGEVTVYVGYLRILQSDCIPQYCHLTWFSAPPIRGAFSFALDGWLLTVGNSIKLYNFYHFKIVQYLILYKFKYINKLRGWI